MVGKTYCSRSVHAQQNGVCIFVMMVSLVAKETSLLVHQVSL